MEAMDVRERLENHEERIGKLEQNQEELTKNISELKKHQQETSDILTKVNSNVLTASNDQKELLGKLIGYHFDMKTQELVNSTEVKKQELLNSTEVKKQELTGKTEVSKIKWQTVTGLLGTGGFVAIVFQWIITLIQGGAGQ